MLSQLQPPPARLTHWLCLALGALVLAACAGTDSTAPRGQTSTSTTSALTLPDGFRAEMYAAGLRSPTALAWGPQGVLYITQLSGGENAATGQVVTVDRPGAEPAVVLEGLYKPTGLAWRETELYIVAGRDILVSGRDSTGRLATPRPVVEQLPFNSRSQGQIDVLPDGRLLFEASGDRNDHESGRLFTMLPGGQPQVLASGLKNAYAHAVDPAGGVYTTDIHDDAVDGRPPLDEINLPGQDYGWPRCNGRGQPATSLGGSTQLCAVAQPALATFAANTTPTGLAWYGGADFPEPYRDTLYVALWNGSPPQVLRVAPVAQGGRPAGEATPFAQGLERPIDVLPDPRGGLLVLDFAAGIVYRVLPAD